MKKKIIITFMFALFTCGIVNVSATSIYKSSLQINSGDAVTFGTGSKSTNTASTSASLDVVGAPDDIYFYTYTSDTTAILTPVLLVREGQSASVNYMSGKPSYAGLGIKVLVRAKDFSWGSFPITGTVNIY